MVPVPPLQREGSGIPLSTSSSSSSLNDNKVRKRAVDETLTWTSSFNISTNIDVYNNNLGRFQCYYVNVLVVSAVSVLTWMLFNLQENKENTKLTRHGSIKKRELKPPAVLRSSSSTEKLTSDIGSVYRSSSHEKLSSVDSHNTRPRRILGSQN